MRNNSQSLISKVKIPLFYKSLTENEKNKNGTIPFLHLLICMKLVQVERKTLIKYLVEQGANKKKF